MKYKSKLMLRIIDDDEIEIDNDIAKIKKAGGLILFIFVWFFFAVVFLIKFLHIIGLSWREKLER